MNYEKVFAICTDKSLIPLIYKDLLETEQKNRKRVKAMNRQITRKKMYECLLKWKNVQFYS